MLKCMKSHKLVRAAGVCKDEIGTESPEGFQIAAESVQRG